MSQHQATTTATASAVVAAEQAEPGFHPPQQARSRAALQRLLTSAEHVLVNQGPEEFTIAAVAEHAGVSVGGIYRRFAGKEQLLDAVRDRLLTDLEEAVADGLDTAEPTLPGVVRAFTRAATGTFAKSGHVFPTLIAAGRTPEAPQRALRTVATLQRLFIEAAAPHHDHIRRADPATALTIALRSILTSSAHRAAVSPWWPDGLSWEQWANEIADMATAYLTTPEFSSLPLAPGAPSSKESL